MGKKPPGVTESAARRAKDVTDTEAQKSAPAERVQVCLPAAAGIAVESSLRAGIGGNECRSNFIADFECIETDRRSEPDA
jgi:hypothetical protein